MDAPTATRPKFGLSYGIAGEADGMLEWSWADDRLEGRPVRVYAWTEASFPSTATRFDF